MFTEIIIRKHFRARVSTFLSRISFILNAPLYPMYVSITYVFKHISQVFNKNNVLNLE